MALRTGIPPIPTVREIGKARKAFHQREPRNLFYRVATELIDLSIRKATTLSVSEALSVLLQTWNKSFYRFHDGFSEKHLRKIENLIDSHWTQFAAFRQRSIESFTAEDQPIIVSLFTDFERVLGPVGSAKCLHLLAPRFFPLWDRAITKAYRVWLKPGRSNSKMYLRFMGYAKQQCDALRSNGETCQDLLKGTDEYNYCTFTLKEDSSPVGRRGARARTKEVQ
jgi:hypothetical protein